MIFVTYCYYILPHKTLLRIHKMTYSCNADWKCVLDGGKEMCTEFQLETHVVGVATED
jgi:hypothetical protein